MTPLRIDLADYIKNFKGFFDLIRSLLNVEDEDKVKTFYNDLIDTYKIVIIEKETGEILQAYSKDGYWVMTKYYLQTKTKSAEQELKDKLSAKENKKDNSDELLNSIKLKINEIFKKVETEGEESLTRKERKFLLDNSDLI